MFAPEVIKQAAAIRRRSRMGWKQIARRLDVTNYDNLSRRVRNRYPALTTRPLEADVLRRTVELRVSTPMTWDEIAREVGLSEGQNLRQQVQRRRPPGLPRRNDAMMVPAIGFMHRAGYTIPDIVRRVGVGPRYIVAAIRKFEAERAA